MLLRLLGGDIVSQVSFPGEPPFDLPADAEMTTLHRQASMPPLVTFG